MPRTPTGRSTTIGDVAHAAGVSRATVSRVLNGRATVDPVLVARVESAIAQLAYRPSETARNLSLGRTNTIAVVVPDLGNPMFQAILHGVTLGAAEDGFQVLVGDTQERAEVERRVALDARRRCDALLLCAPRMADDDLVAVLADAAPIALINRTVDAPVHQLALDYRHTIRLVAGHLAGLGHRRVIYLGGPPSSASNRLRLDGIDDARRLHPQLRVEQLEVGTSLDDGAHVAEAVLATDATAVIAFNDLVAIGLLSRLDDLGVRVPERLSVVGVDDIPFARYSRPHLTTVSVPQGSLGALAWAQLKDAMAGASPGAPVWVQGTLVERASTGPAPA